MKPINKAREYTYRVFWSEEDRAYVGTVAEFPSLSHIADSQEQALLGIVNVVDHAIEILIEDGREVPEPLGRKTFSGKISLRMTPEQHRRVAIEAAESGVSINQLLMSRV